MGSVLTINATAGGPVHPSPTDRDTAPAWQLLRSCWPITIGAIALAAPVLAKLAWRDWTTEQGAHGPIILATGLWLLWYKLRGRPAGPPGNRWLAATALGISLTGYTVSGVLGLYDLQWLMVEAALVTTLYLYAGRATIARLWFPLTYLVFMLPPPAGLLQPAIGQLRLALAKGAVTILGGLGYDVAYNGTTLYIDQYEVYVANACSGVNSLVGLLAIGLFYAYLRHRADWRHTALLALSAVPIAIMANLVRILLILLVFHYLGNAAAQGLLHELAGQVMFVIALASLIALDGATTAMFRNRKERT